MDHDIFISYAQKAPEPTVALADELVRRGFRPWYDVNLLPGQFFGQVIDDAIDKAKAVVTIWSPPALSSLWVPAESARALRQNKLICVRTVDLETGKLPTPFHNMHTPVWTEFSAVVQALIAMGVRPGGLGDATLDTEKLMHAAQRDWRAMPDHDAEALEAFLEEYGEFPMYRRMAQKRLDALRTSTPSPRPAPRPEPPSVKAEDVLLRLDPDMHTAKIGRISVSADGRLLATASNDKTVKLWALPEGKLLRTLRPPIGPGNEGKVYAVALDPAGRWVAAGGWLSKGDDLVLLFDTSTGAVRARLGHLPNVVNHLAVSPDGTRLAAGLGGKNGLRVWDVARALAGEARPVFEDREIGGDVYGLAFGPAGTAAAGRLAATSEDGHVRLYALEGQCLAKVKAPGGEQPYGIAFAPEGRTLALGYHDALRVDLLEAGTLRVLGSVDVTGLSGGNLGSVAFLHPARPGAAPRLVAGGKRTNQGRLFVWTEVGSGSRILWPGPDSTVMDVAALPEGGLAYGAGDPAFGLLDADGKRTLFRSPATADLRDKKREHFTVSADGRRLRFGLKPFSGAPVLFDLDRRQLTEAPQPLPDLAPANTDRLPITGWQNTREPQLGGKALPLEAYERASSLAIAPDAHSFVLGTHFRLRRYDAKGAPLWQQPVPGTVWGVNLACEGRLILAAYGDGTIQSLRTPWQHRRNDRES
jgi:WD40 repeat protein